MLLLSHALWVFYCCASIKASRATRSGPWCGRCATELCRSNYSCFLWQQQRTLPRLLQKHVGVQSSGDERTSSASLRGARYVLEQVGQVVVDVLVFQALLQRKWPEREQVLLTRWCKLCRRTRHFAFKLHTVLNKSISNKHKLLLNIWFKWRKIIWR